jgi:predicted Zn-ribbon and HTH transcriptional regulator
VKWWTDHFRDQVTEQLPVSRCPLCGSHRFHVGRDPARLDVANLPTAFIVVPVECDDCGYLALFNSDRFRPELGRP